MFDALRNIEGEKKKPDEERWNNTNWMVSICSFFSVFSTNLITSFSLLFIGHNVFFHWIECNISYLSVIILRWFVTSTHNSIEGRQNCWNNCAGPTKAYRENTLFMSFLFIWREKNSDWLAMFSSLRSQCYTNTIWIERVCVCVCQWYGRFVSSSVINTETYIQYMEQMLNTIHSFLSFVRRERMNRIRGRCGDTFSKLITIENK